MTSTVSNKCRISPWNQRRNFWAAATHKGEVVRYPGLTGKIRAALALLKGDLAAVPLLPKMLAKRRSVNRIRKLSPREVRALILQHRIPLKELTEQAI